MPLLLGLSFLISSLTYKFYFMEYLIRNLIEQLIIKKELELNYIEKYKNDGLNDLVLISSGKVLELEVVIQKLKDMIGYYNTTK